MAEHRTDERDPRDDARDPWQEEVASSPETAGDDRLADEPGPAFWANREDPEPDAADIAPEPEVNEAVRAERERLVAERAARKEARLSALNPPPPPVVPVAAPAGSPVAAVASVPAEPVVVTRRSTDAFAGALGLFLLRLVVAAIIGVHGVNKLLNLPATTETLQNTILPAPSILAIVVGAAEVAIAIALLFGLLTRVAGFGLILVAGGALAFVLWGPWSPFRPGQAGFTGELELLLAAVGVLFLLVGGGGWSVDRGFRARRAADKAARAAG